MEQHVRHLMIDIIKQNAPTDSRHNLYDCYDCSFENVQRALESAYEAGITAGNQKDTLGAQYDRV